MKVNDSDKITLIKKITILLSFLFVISMVGAGYFIVNASNTVVTDIVLTVDYSPYESEDLPIGIAGESYAVFNATAIDNSGNSVTDIDVLVRDPDGKLLLIENNRFKTEKTGEYTIIYTAKYLSLNAFETVKVRVTETGEKIEYKADERIKTQGVVGQRFSVYQGTYGGGVGELDFDMQVLDENGNAIELSVAKDSYFFIPLTSGEYKITYTITDFVGQIKHHQISFVISDSLEPVFSVPAISKVARMGDKVTFPIADAKVYVGGKEYYLPVKIYCDEVDVTDEKAVIFETAGKHIVKYVAQNLFDENYNATQTFEVTVYDPSVVLYPTPDIDYEEYARYIDSFMFLDNFVPSYSEMPDAEDYMGVYVLNADDNKDYASFEFKTKIYKEFLSVKLGSEDGADFSAITFKFTDSKNANDSVSVTFKEIITEEDDVVVAVYVADVLKKTFATTFKNFLVGGLNLLYNDELKSITDDTGEKIVDLDFFDDGRVFTGFKSEKAYLSFSISGITAPVRIKLSSIAQSNITGSFIDLGSPLFVTDAKFRDVISADIGDVVTLVKVKAFDLLDENVNVKLTVKDPEGEKVYEGNGSEDYKLTVLNSGTYSVEYTASDTRGNSKSKKASVYVADRIPPVIEVKAIPKSVSVGTEIELSDYKVTDNVTEQEDIQTYIYVVYENYQKKMLSDKYKFEKVGEYVIRYVAYDADTNCTIVEFKVLCN